MSDSASRRRCGRPSGSVVVHHRSRSIHGSPFSATRTSKRLIPHLSERSAASQTVERVQQAAAAGLGRRVGHPADRLLLDPEPHLVAWRVQVGPEPEGSVGLPRGPAALRLAAAGLPQPGAARDGGGALRALARRLRRGPHDLRPAPAPAAGHHRTDSPHPAISAHRRGAVRRPRLPPHAGASSGSRPVRDPRRGIDHAPA